MSELKDISTERLERELERRQKEARAAGKPKQVENPDLIPLRAICQNYIDCLDSEDYCDDDYQHYIYEVAMQVLFGKDIFIWINEQKK